MKIVVIAFYLLTSSVLANIDPMHGLVDDHPITSSCEEPQFLHPAARQLTTDYRSSFLSKAEYLEKFVWLEPTHEDYALCVVCNDPSTDYADWTDWSESTMIFCHGDFEYPPHF